MSRAASWSGQAIAFCALLSCAAPLPEQTATATGQTSAFRLVGIGCGPAKEILIAVEEDHFPRCAAIDTPQNFCGTDSAEACARRLRGAP